MQPNLPSPAPPPVNPYDFLNEAPKQKRSLLPSGNSKRQRIIFVVIGFIGLLIAGLIILAVLNSAGSSVKQDLLIAARQQQEIIRITTLGKDKLRDPTARNLAATTQLTMQSDQTKLQPILKKEGVKADAKSLALGKNPKTDQELTTADQANRFDEVFIQTLHKELTDYQKTLKRIEEASTSKSTKGAINEQSEHVSQLLDIK